MPAPGPRYRPVVSVVRWDRMPSWTEFLSPAIVIGVVICLWRDANNRIASLATTVTQLAVTVADIDRRLATLEGCITGWQDRRHSPAPSE